MTSILAAQPLVKITNLCKTYRVGGGLFAPGRDVEAVRDVSFEIDEGKTLGLVGESGSGKSTVGRMLLRLEDHSAGQIYFDGSDVSLIKASQFQVLRREMQMIFQNPFGALNPRMRVGDIVEEPLIIHGLYKNKAERKDYVADLFKMVGLDPGFGARYPHEFSGGQRQRIVIARAISLRPRFIVADEPITALDVSIQAQIINLLEDLQQKLNLTYLFIAHDLSMVRYLCHKVAVMCQGRIVETGLVEQVFDNPMHPYTKSLLSAVPIPDPDLERCRRRIPPDKAAIERSLSGCLIEVAPEHHVLMALN